MNGAARVSESAPPTHISDHEAQTHPAPPGPEPTLPLTPGEESIISMPEESGRTCPLQMT